MSWRRVWLCERKRKKGKTHCLRWYDDRGRMRARSVGRDKKLAEQERTRLEYALNRGQFGGVTPIRLRAFVEEHLELIVNRVQPTTVKDQRYILQRAIDFFGDVPLDRITPRSAEGLLAMRLREVRPATANKFMRTLKSAFTKAIQRGYLRENPFRFAKPVREPEREIRVLSLEEMERLLAACPNETWRTFVFFALTTGLRRGELCHLEWSDIDLERGVIQVRCKDGHRTKSARNRAVAAVPEAVELLMRLKLTQRGSYVFQYGDGEQWTENLSPTFARIVRRAGIARCTIHDLRRTFISHLAMAGVNEAVVQKIAGHQAISTTLRHYTRMFDDRLMAASMRLPYRAIVSKSCREVEKAG